MTNTEILVIVLVLTAWWIYYQSQQPSLASKGTQTELQTENKSTQTQEKEEREPEEPKVQEIKESNNSPVNSRTSSSSLEGEEEVKEPRLNEARLNYYQSEKETIEEYLRRKYSMKNYQFAVYANKGNWKDYTFADKGLIWDYMLCSYSSSYSSTRYSFPLINVDDLTELIKQLDENNWKEPKMLKKLGLDEQRIKFLGEDKVYVIIDNLANQIIARCVVVANRLTHGEDKESEDNIIKLGLMFQKCAKIPELKIFSYSLYEEEAKVKLEGLVNQARQGDKSLLQKLQDLPYLKEEFRLKD